MTVGIGGAGPFVGYYSRQRRSTDIWRSCTLGESIAAIHARVVDEFPDCWVSSAGKRSGMEVSVEFGKSDWPAEVLPSILPTAEHILEPSRLKSPGSSEMPHDI